MKDQRSKKSQYTHEEEDPGWNTSQTETKINYAAMLIKAM